MKVERPSLRSHPELDFSAETHAARRVEGALQPPEHLGRLEVFVPHGVESNAFRELNSEFTHSFEV